MLTRLAIVMLLAATSCGDQQFSKETSPVSAPSPSSKRPIAPSKLSRSGYEVSPLPEARVKELAAALDQETYRVTQKAGTEPAFCGNLTDNKKDGVYVCVVCGLPLFSSDAKFNSGTGWPSFFAPFDRAHISTKEDSSHGMVRTEINCARCGSHLGHVFADGPEPTGQRHCLNSVSLKFFEMGSTLPPDSRPVELETAYFAGGCFWGVEHSFQQAPGVASVESGYMQGTTENPSYKDVCGKQSGHAEAVKVTFDPRVISYKQLVDGFFRIHDPTELNRQGPDVGTQYRSGLYCTSEDQLKTAKDFVEELRKSDRWKDPIVTEVEMAKRFYPAEEYHQDYVEQTGRSCHSGNPWPEILGQGK